MFFFEATSHSVGSPFIDDTMLRSGVPPHIGQSPVPGSEAATRIGRVAASASSTSASRGAVERNNDVRCCFLVMAFRLVNTGSGYLLAKSLRLSTYAPNSA